MDRPIEIIEPRGKQVPQLPPADGLPKEALRRRRRLWIVGLAVIALVVGVEVVLGVVNRVGARLLAPWSATVAQCCQDQLASMLMRSSGATPTS